MLSKVEKYRQRIQKQAKRVLLFPNLYNQEKKPIIKLYCDVKLPSSHPIKSSQQIDNSMPITNHISHQPSKQYPTTLQIKWPKSCIGLILCEHHQNNQTFYVYGTGILIHSKIVLTSAQNVYCRRLNTQYTNIRFIVGVSGDKCNRIYDAKRIHYPKEYTMQEYENYNFAVVQLYNDLSVSCGYVGWKTIRNIEVQEKYTEYKYISGNKVGSFELRERTKNKIQQQDQGYCSGSGLLIKENENMYYIVGLQHKQRQDFLSEKIRNIINQWTEFTTIDLIQAYKQIGAQGCKHLSQINWKHLNTINLANNNIGAQGCKYLSQNNWTHLIYINLPYNNIGVQGCKYLSQTNCQYLIYINLCLNNIDAQGCKYLSQSNWKYLAYNNLSRNNIGTQGCKYLSQSNWTHLKYINLAQNRIEDIDYRLQLLQVYPNNTIKI